MILWAFIIWALVPGLAGRWYDRGVRRLHLALALLLITPYACKKTDPQADGRRVTAESDYDATQPIVHEGFRFRLGSPGEGWKLMRKQDIRRMVPDAVAGATSRDGIFGGVIVERLPGIDLDKAEELVSANLPNAVQQSTEDIEISGVAARKTIFTAAMEGVEFRYTRVLLIREGYLYQLLAWGQKAKTSATALQPFIDAFSLTEGEIRGEVDDRPPVEHADGVIWQIREGRFASVVSGLQLPAVDSWRFLVGQELMQTNAEAELALANDTVGGYVAVISERYDSSDPSGMVDAIRADLTQNLGSGTEVGSRTIAGKEVPFMRYQTEMALEFEVGVMTGDGAITQVMTWYPQALRNAALPAFEQVVGQMTLASAAERKALHEQLLAREGVVWKVGAKSAFLGKTFRDFEHQVTWTLPRGLYEVRVGDEAKADGADIVLALQGPLLAVYAHVEVVEGGASRTGELHEAVAGTLSGRRNEAGVIDGTVVQRSFGTERLNDVEVSVWRALGLAPGQRDRHDRLGAGHLVDGGPRHRGHARGAGSTGCAPQLRRRGGPLRRLSARGQRGRARRGLGAERRDPRGCPDRSRHPVEEGQRRDRADQHSGAGLLR